MKTSHLMPLMLAMMLLTTSVTAQKIVKSSNPPDLSVLEQSWRKESRLPLLNNDPLRPNEEYMKIVRLQKEVIERRDESLPNQTTEERMPVPTGSSIAPGMPRPISYVYKIKVKNTGAKTIKSIFWEYEFLDPDTQEVMGHRRIASSAKILPGKSQVLERRFNSQFSQPTRVVAAGTLDKKYQDQFTERVIIHRIHYADGSSWQRKQ